MAKKNNKEEELAEGAKVIVTQEMLDNDSELVANGVLLGDEITLGEIVEKEESEEESKEESKDTSDQKRTWSIQGRDKSGNAVGPSHTKHNFTKKQADDFAKQVKGKKEISKVTVVPK